jgi:RHS repeat-associated protein
LDGTVLREFVRMGSAGGVVAEIVHDDPTVASEHRNAVYYYHYNHRGDVIAVSKNGGSLVFMADYDAYGRMTRLDEGEFTPRYTYSTKRYFSDFDLYYFGFRWYMPALGRWMQADPAGYAGGSLNQYRYCGNNPLMRVDPYGLKDSDCEKSSRGGGSDDDWTLGGFADGELYIQDYIEKLSENPYSPQHLLDVPTSDLDIRNTRRNEFFSYRREIYPPDVMGNFGPAYALTVQYGPLIAALQCVGAELVFGPVHPDNRIEDAVGSFSANIMGIGQAVLDNPSLLFHNSEMHIARFALGAVRDFFIK